jgi:hypothetical protein
LQTPFGLTLPQRLDAPSVKLIAERMHATHLKGGDGIRKDD